MPTLLEKKELASSIGASHEVKETVAAIHRQEIDNLMKGMPYYEVSEKDLEHLFKIDVINSTITALAISIPIIIACSLFSWGVWVSNTGEARIAGMVLGDVFGLLLGFAISMPIAESLKVELKMEGLGETRIRIPYGAMLRVKEAKDSKMFNAFFIVYPAKKEKLAFNDPAIVGRLPDGRLKMIVYWDIKKDIERVLKDIRTSFPLKLKDHHE